MRTATVAFLVPLFTALAAFAGDFAPEASPASVIRLRQADGRAVTEFSVPVYHRRVDHIWNRLFSNLYVRTRPVDLKTKKNELEQFAGGDTIDFLGWGRTTWWSEESTVRFLSWLLDQFPGTDADELMADPVRRAVMLRDLWAAYDFLTYQNMRRYGSLETRKRRHSLSRKLAKAIEALAMPKTMIKRLPDTYAVALKSGHFLTKPIFDDSADYLPPGLLTKPDEWVEIDFFQPDLHEDLSLRFVTMHTREFVGRSYFRVFYRFPEGRKQLTAYLLKLDRDGVDWKQAAQNGFILLKKDAPQIPVGTEVALLQFMMTLDEDLTPVPTKVVESIRHRFFRNVDGASKPETNTGIGMHVTEYTMKRHLLFDGLKHGGLHRENMQAGQFRTIFQPDDGPDWGTIKDKVLFQQCADCHTTPKGTRTGVHSIPSIVHMGGFDSGAQLGIAKPMPPNDGSLRGNRAVKWKTQHETWRRLLDDLGR